MQAALADRRHDVAPRTGARIETALIAALRASRSVAPRTGARIETIVSQWRAAEHIVAPRTGARIETFNANANLKAVGSPPARGRGSKPV